LEAANVAPLLLRKAYGREGKSTQLYNIVNHRENHTAGAFNRFKPAFRRDNHRNQQQEGFTLLNFRRRYIRISTRIKDLKELKAENKAYSALINTGTD